MRVIDEGGRRVPEAHYDGVARYVGRVGALAVALGVGAVIGTMPMAAADTGGSPGSTGTGSASTGADSAAGNGPATRARTTRSAAQTGMSRDPASNRGGDSPAAQRGGGDGPGVAAAAPARAGSARSVIPLPERGSEQPPAGLAPSASEPTSVTPMPPVDVSAGAGDTGADRDGPSRRASRSTTRSAIVPAPTGEIYQPAPDGVQPVAVEAPVLMAPRAAAAAGLVRVGPDLLAWLRSGGDDGAPALLPLMWSAAAVSRRDLGGVSPAAPKSAAASTGEPVDPVARLLRAGRLGDLPERVSYRIVDVESNR